MAFKLPDLPYARSALTPHVSAQTLSFHHGKHHRAYLAKLSELVKDGPLAGKGLAEIIAATANEPTHVAVFNNAAQAWNHDFFWRSMKPGGGGRPKGALADRIDDEFGGYDNFAEQFVKVTSDLFGSGWVWLVVDGGRLAIAATRNADLPLIRQQTPLFTLDLWEHAYYLDYQNRRHDFVAAYLDHLVNWEFAVENFAAAAGRQAGGAIKSGVKVGMPVTEL